jgi:peptide/nickel transport system substrate-binding protein
MTRHRPTTGTGFLAACALAAGCGDAGETAGAGAVSDAERAGGIAVVCANAVPESLNPFISGDVVVADLRLLLFTPLVLFDSAGGVRPYLARAWEWQDEQRRLVLRLRDDVRWQDGRPVSAEDVAWTVLAAADSAYTYQSWDDVAAVRDAVVRDSTTVELIFDAPFTAGLEPFAQLPILPQHLLGEVPAGEFARAEYHRAPIGSGPFRFTGRMADGALQFDRVADFPEDLGRALLDRIVLRGVPDASAILIELQTGNVDACVTGSSLASQVLASPRLEAIEVVPAGVQVIPLSTSTPPFDDARVRRAFSAALERAELAATISPLMRPARTYLPAGADRWVDAALLQPDSDSALAAALLDSAGWSTVGTDGIRRNAAGEPLRFTIAAPQQLQTFLTIAQAQLRAAGMDARLEFMEGAAFGARIMNPATRPAAFAISLFPDRVMLPDPSSQLHSGGGMNLAGYHSVEVDSLLARLTTALPDDERAAIYHTLQRRVAEDVPMVYTVYFPRMLAVGPRLEGVRADLNGPFASVARWWIPPAQRRRGPAQPADTGAAAGS